MSVFPFAPLPAAATPRTKFYRMEKMKWLPPAPRVRTAVAPPCADSLTIAGRAQKINALFAAQQIPCWVNEHTGEIKTRAAGQLVTNVDHEGTTYLWYPEGVHVP